MFSNDNRGCMITIEVAVMAIGDQMLTDAVPLFAIDYDPTKKGDDLVISTGLGEMGFAHKISAPAEIWEAQDENGKVVAREVIKRKGAKTIIVFKS